MYQIELICATSPTATNSASLRDQVIENVDRFHHEERKVI